MLSKKQIIAILLSTAVLVNGEGEVEVTDAAEDNNTDSNINDEANSDDIVDDEEAATGEDEVQAESEVEEEAQVDGDQVSEEDEETPVVEEAAADEETEGEFEEYYEDENAEVEDEAELEEATGENEEEPASEEHEGGEVIGTYAVVELEEIINANCSMDTVSPGTSEYSLTQCSSLQECSRDFDCNVDEHCGTILQEGVQWGETRHICVYQDECKSIGKINDVAFSIQCYDNQVEEVLPSPTELLATVEEVTTVEGAGAWTDIRNMKVLSLYDFENGLWIRNNNQAEIGIYTKYYKPVNNLCQLNADCAYNECCSAWPDTYNKRCISKDLDGKVYSMRPFMDFVPTCAADVGTHSAPTSAMADLVFDAEAIAAEQVDEFHTLVENTMRLSAAYDDMTFYEQESWDEALAEEFTQRDHADASDREFAGYHSMSDEGRAVYDAEFLKFKKEWFAECEEAKTSIECTNGRELRSAMELVRKVENYYELHSDARNILDVLYAEDSKQEVAALTALWIANNKPPAGFVGASCAQDNKCLGADQCCGTATPQLNEDGDFDGQVESVCAHQTNNVFTNDLGITYTHVCGAERLLATAGALLAAIYLM